MSDHVAEQIVSGAALALVGLTTTGSNVFDSLLYPLQKGDLPALRIDQGNEDDSQVSSDMDPLFERTMDLMVQAVVKQTTGYRQTLNTIRKETEIRLAANGTVGGAKYVIPKTCVMSFSVEGDQPTAEATMTFSVCYYTAQSAPDVAL